MMNEKNVLKVLVFENVSVETIERALVGYEATHDTLPTVIRFEPMNNSLKTAIVKNESMNLKALSQVQEVEVPKGFELIFEDLKACPRRIKKITLIDDGVELESKIIDPTKSISRINTFGLHQMEGGKLKKRDLIVHQVKRGTKLLSLISFIL